MRTLFFILLLFLFTGCNAQQAPNHQQSPAPTMESPSPEPSPIEEEPSQEPQSQEEPQPQEEAQPQPDPQPMVLSTFSTPVLDTEENHVVNMQLASQAINGMVLGVGEIFSFNAVVGQASVQRGYRMAPIIVDGKVEQGEGGGICQVSSTIYNAATAAGMTILERHNHGVPVGYVEQGRDAAISYGTYDLQFRNDTQSPVTIYVWVTNEAVTAQMTE